MKKKRDFKQARKTERKINAATVKHAQEAAAGKKKPARKRKPAAKSASGDEYIKRKLRELFPGTASRKFFDELGRASEQGPDLVYRLAMTQATLCAQSLSEYLKTAEGPEAMAEMRNSSTVISRLLASCLTAAKLDYEFNLAAHPDRITVEWGEWTDANADALTVTPPPGDRDVN